MDYSNVNLQVRKLQRWEKALRRNQLLTKRSYSRAKTSFQHVLTKKSTHQQPCDKSPADVVLFLRGYERLNERIDKTCIRYKRTYSLYNKSFEFVSLAAHHVIKHELSTVFAKLNVLLPHIVDRITIQALTYSTEIVNQRREENKEAHEEMLIAEMARNRHKEKYDMYMDLASKNEDVKMAVLSFYKDLMIRRRKRLHKVERLLRYIQHKMWKARNPKAN